MFRGGGCRGGGRRGGFGGRGGMIEDTLPHSSGLHFYGAIGLPLGNRTHFTLMAPGDAIPMVSIAAMDGIAPNRVTYERLAMEACLEQL
ncbi:hypothetical protein PAHAL_2G181800 [Panicum hallii]|uniref:Uncharacterized protein n=1 Tax=Panicum hallii TaxID=206008 RepID=A0A2T8KPL3_9POAL|nr:hypothetical protein PAHAL_2G181800 [Panicum hallii]